MAQPSARIIQGDVLEVLRRLPSESVHTCVTSPPYWGLRDYGVSEQVWGGDPEHRHSWGPEILVHATNHTDKRRWNHARDGRGEEQPTEKRPGWKRQKIGQSSLCLCGAWRGALGLEPTFDLYVAHIVDVFREVWRVLRPDGTLWLNLGDCYATGQGPTRTAHGKRTDGYGRAEGYRGGQGASPKHARKQVPDQKNPNAGIPTYQPNRMPQPGLKPKDLVGIPWRVALALQADGWYLRSDIIWAKPNPMPESVRDRPTKAHEYLFLMTKQVRYYYDHKAVAEPVQARNLHDLTGPGYDAPGQTPQRGSRSGNKHRRLQVPTRPNDHRGSSIPWQGVKRNRRTVWTITTRPFKGAHFATFPPKLIEPCILAGSPNGGTVLDCFNGAGTTGLVALEHGRNYLGIELNPEYCHMTTDRLKLRAAAAHP